MKLVQVTFAIAILLLALAYFFRYEITVAREGGPVLFLVNRLTGTVTVCANGTCWPLPERDTKQQQ